MEKQFGSNCTPKFVLTLENKALSSLRRDFLVCLCAHLISPRIYLFVYLDFADKLAVLIVIRVRKLVNLDLVFLDLLHDLRKRKALRVNYNVNTSFHMEDKIAWTG